MAIPLESLLGNLGSIAGTGLGSGISRGLDQGLHALANMKLQQLQRSHQAYALAPALAPLFPNKSPQELQSLSLLSDTLLKPIIQQQLQEPQQMAFNNALSQLYGIPRQAEETLEPSAQQSPAVASAPSRSMTPTRNISAESADLFKLGQGLNPKNFEKLLGHYNQLATRAQTERISSAKMQQDLDKFARKMAFDQKKHEFEQLKHAEKQGFEKLKLDLGQMREAEKESKDFYTELTAEAKAAKNSEARLNKMEQIVKRGNLPQGAWYRLTADLREQHGLAGGLGSLLSIFQSANPDAEEFEKLSADFIKDAKNYFGGRLTDADLRAYLRTVPTLSQTDAGKERIIGNLKTFNKIAEIKKKAADQIIKANNNRRPRDLDRQVEERVAPQIDALTEAFLVDITNVPRIEQPYIDKSSASNATLGGLGSTALQLLGKLGGR